MDFPPMDMYIRPQYMPIPIPWHMMKGYGGKLVVELGFGRGEYLLTLSEYFPEALIIGFEVSITSLLKAAYRIQKAERGNVKLLLFDGVIGLSEFFNDSSVDSVYMNFPVPWPKKRHAKRRVIRPQFWNTLARVLRVGGCFELMTDVEWYAYDAKESAEETSNFDVYIERNPIRRVQTKYEEKWLKEGRDIYLLRACKSKAVNISYQRLFVKGADFMPHVVIRRSWESLKGLLKDLEYTEVVVSKDMRFGIREVFAREREVLLRSFTIDKGFFQSFYVWVRPEDKEGQEAFLIKLDPLSSPFRTKSLMALMKFIKDKIGEEFVVRHNLG